MHYTSHDVPRVEHENNRREASFLLEAPGRGGRAPGRELFPKSPV
jgi:hypothetical protein